MIHFDCPNCGRTIKVEDDWAGRKGKCPGCRETIQIPNAASEQNPPVKPATKSQDDVSDRWFLKTEDGDDYGPVEKAELDQWVKEGLVTLNCHIWQEGVSQWRPAKEIYPELGREEGESIPPIRHPMSPTQEVVATPVTQSPQPPAKRQAAICSQCGNTLASGVRFCATCGTPVNGISVPTSAPQAPNYVGTRDQQFKTNLVYPRNPPLSPHLCWLNVLFAAGLAQLLYGQVAKGIVMWIVMIASNCLLPVVLALAIGAVSVIDAYMVGSVLRKGVPVGKWEFMPRA